MNQSVSLKRKQLKRTRLPAQIPRQFRVFQYRRHDIRGRMVTIHRMKHCLISILLGCILASAVIPDGYMPSDRTDSFGFVLCQIGWASSDHSDDNAHPICPFAATPTGHGHYASGLPVGTHTESSDFHEVHPFWSPSHTLKNQQARAPPPVS